MKHAPPTEQASPGNRQPAESYLLTIRGGLACAFGVLLGLMLLVCLLAWLLYDELGSDLERMSSEMLPQVVQSRNLAMANNSLATLAGKMAQASSAEELERQARFARLATERLNQALDDGGQLFDGGQLQVLRQLTRQIAETLEHLDLAVHKQFALQASFAQTRQQIRQTIDGTVAQAEKTLVAEDTPDQVRFALLLMKMIREGERALNSSHAVSSQADLDALIVELSESEASRDKVLLQLEQEGGDRELVRIMRTSGWNQGALLQYQADLLEGRSQIEALVASSSQLSAQFRLLTTVFVKRSSEQVQQLQQAANEEIDRNKRLMVMVMTFCLLLSVLLVWYFGHRRMARPLELLSRAVSALERGEAEPVSPRQGVREIQELSEAFDRMSETLGSRDRELMRLHLLLKNVIDSLPPMLLAVDRDCRLTLWNLQTEKKCVSEKLVVGHPVIDTLGWLPLKADLLERAVAQGEPLLLKNLQVEYPGQQRIFELSCNPLIDVESPGAVLRLEDVTERLRLEQAIAQSEKMLSVGGLAAGVAHEINNPLAGIMQNAQVLENRLCSRLPGNIRAAEESGLAIEALEDYLERRGIGKMLSGIRNSANQAAKTVRMMLAFGRSGSAFGEPCYEQVDLIPLLEDTLSLLSSDYDLRHGYDFRKIELNRNLSEPLPFVCCDPALIQQVFFNLLKNCAQMFGKQGVERADACIRVAMRRVAEQVVFSVEDNGPGMPEEVRQRIFEPFFTTREVGLGSGLGLSVVYFIVSDFHHGTISVESTPGKGSRFEVRLPIEQPGHALLG